MIDLLDSISITQYMESVLNDTTLNIYCKRQSISMTRTNTQTTAISTGFMVSSEPSGNNAALRLYVR